MIEILKSLWKKIRITPIYYIKEEVPRVLGTPIRRK